MAEPVPSNMYQPITQWIADHFYGCEGYSVPRCLLYEMYVENCKQAAWNQVNPATFGKLVRLVFPDLGTRRLGTRGSARYHYDGIQIKKSSPFYAYYSYLLDEKKNSTYQWHPHFSCSSENTTNYQSNGYGKGTVTLLADEYCTYCQEVLRSVRNKELDQVEKLFTSFWKSLQPEAIMFMSQSDVGQLFQCYDRQLFQEMEKSLLCDFLEDFSIQYLKLIRLFCKHIKIWLLAAMEDFPPLFTASKIKEVTVFVNRLRRKTYLANMAKTMRIVLNNSRSISTLKADVNAIITQGFVDIPGNSLEMAFKNVNDIESGMELKCLNNLLSLLDTSTDIRVLLNCLSSNLEAFVIQPSKNPEEFRKLAANFQLRWNFLLTSISKAMTLCHADSFGSWHLFNLLLLEYVIHVLQSHIEEEGDGAQMRMQQDNTVFPPASLLGDLAAGPPEVGGAAPTHIMLTHSLSDVNFSTIILSVLSCLVDADTGTKLIQVLLEDKASKSSIKMNLPVGQEALVTLKDGQTFIIHTSDPQQTCSSV